MEHNFVWTYKFKPVRVGFEDTQEEQNYYGYYTKEVTHDSSTGTTWEGIWSLKFQDTSVSIDVSYNHTIMTGCKRYKPYYQLENVILSSDTEYLK